jgi:hypothetical protein
MHMFLVWASISARAASHFLVLHPLTECTLFSIPQATSQNKQTRERVNVRRRNRAQATPGDAYIYSWTSNKSITFLSALPRVLIFASTCDMPRQKCSSESLHCKVARPCSVARPSVVGAFLRTRLLNRDLVGKLQPSQPPT